jgi:capsular exopolysaccharide synthesis family protein
VCAANEVISRTAPTHGRSARVEWLADPGQPIRIAGGAFGAIVFSISFWEHRAHRIHSQDDVVHELGIKVVGTMLGIPSTRLEAIWKPSGSQGPLWQHHLIESVDTTRIMPMYEARAELYRVVLVTSAVRGEGKTSLSIHLATSLARSGKRTLLIDGDFRRPMVHRHYDQPRGPGFCELVRAEIGLDDAIRPTPSNNLWIIPAGHHDTHTLSVLSQPGAQGLFDHLREEFDFVVLDSAPVLPEADTLLLSQHADAVLFSVLRDVSQLPKIHAAYERITAKPLLRPSRVGEQRALLDKSGIQEA